MPGTTAARLLRDDEAAIYDGFLTRHPKGHFLQSWSWGQVKQATGWQAHRFLVERGGEPVAAASVLARRLPGMGVFYYAPRGPVVDFADTEALDTLLKAIAQQAAADRATLLKLDPDVSVARTDVDETLRRRGFRLTGGPAKNFEGLQPRFVFRLPITASEDEIMAAFSPKTRYNVRLAYRKGVELRTATEADLKPFYNLLVHTAARDRFLVRDSSYFQAIWDHMVVKDEARLFLAEVEGKLLGATLAFKFGEKVWYLYGASASEDRGYMPNYALQWEMIRWAKASGCTLYDFRGVSGDLDEKNPLYGLYRFKKGFGGELTEFLGEYDLIYRRGAYTLWQVADPAWRVARRLLRLARDLAGR